MITAGNASDGATCRIRQATSEDVPALVELLCALFAIETDFAIHPQRHARGLRRLLRQTRNGGSTVLVALLDLKVVGMATVQTVISTVEGGLSGWIEDVVVAPALRGQGIGARLMAAIDGWARRKGVRRLQLVTDQRNQPALAFYDRLGYQRTHMVAMRRPVSSQGGHRAAAAT